MIKTILPIFQNTNRVPYFCRFHIYGRRGILSHILPEHTTGAFVNSPKVLPKKSQSSSKSNIQSMSSSSSSSSYCSTSSNAIRPSNRVCSLTFIKAALVFHKVNKWVYLYISNYSRFSITFYL